MNEHEPVPDSDEEPSWFRKWSEREEQRRAKHEMYETGFNVFAVGLGAIAVAVGMLALKGISAVQTAQVMAVGTVAMVLGVFLIFASRWAAVRE